MKKDNAKLAELWRQFPCLLSREAEDQIVYDALPQFLFYQKKRGKAWCYCTACRRSDVFQKDVYADGIRVGGSDVPERLKHNDVGTCPMCGHKVTYKCEGRGHKYLRAWGNYAVFTAKDNVLYINAVKVIVSWSHIEEPYIDYEYHRRYIFSEYGSEEMRWTWQSGGFTAMKAINEPVFGMYNMGIDSMEYTHSYTCINDDAIGDTFLRYVPYYDYCQSADVIHPVKFIELCAKNPALCEQLWKCGFSKVVTDMAVGKSVFSKMINWKCTEIKKALGFDAKEMKEFHDNGCYYSLRQIYGYMLLKKIKGINGFDERMNILKADGISLIEEEIKLSRQMRASFVKVRNYIYKHCKSDRYGGALEWGDCNRMMDTLGYPKESVLRFPKSLRKLHDRLVSETNAAEERIRKAQDVPNDLKIKAQEEELSKLIYSNLLYEIVLPKDMQDIRDEGKVLDHCVASYAERHARGATHIFFIRKRWNPEERWYTIEVSAEGYIRQCYGYKDNRTVKKPDSIKQFEKEYRLFLDHVFNRLSDKEYGKEAMKLADNGGNENGRNNNNQLTA